MYISKKQVSTKMAKFFAVISIVAALLLNSTPALGLDYYLTQPLQTPIGPTQPKVSGLSEYFPYLVSFILALIIMAAVITIVVAGIRYATAAGNESAMTQARGWIWDALSGLALALASYLILRTINPDLLNFQLKIDSIKLQSQPSFMGGSGGGGSFGGTGAGGGF